LPPERHPGSSPPARGPLTNPPPLPTSSLPHSLRGSSHAAQTPPAVGTPASARRTRRSPRGRTGSSPSSDFGCQAPLAGGDPRPEDRRTAGGQMGDRAGAELPAPERCGSLFSRSLRLVPGTRPDVGGAPTGSAMVFRAMESLRVHATGRLTIRGQGNRSPFIHRVHRPDEIRRLPAPIYPAVRSRVRGRRAGADPIRRPED